MKQALAEAMIEMAPEEAKEKVAEYTAAVRRRHDREDEQILRGYRALAKGHRVIDLPKVIRLGGVFEQHGLPRIAIATSSHEFVHVERRRDGWVRFQPGEWLAHNRRRDVFECPIGTLPVGTDEQAHRIDQPGRWGTWPWNGGMRAMVPHVPPMLRPRGSLDGYATLFEVEEWAPDPSAPVDPALLKHIGGDLYAVMATWDLSPLEQSVLNGRIR